MKFDPNKYEIVKERKAKFYADYPEGRITVELLNPESIMGHALYKACVYRTREDQIEGLPTGVGTALEIREKELSTSNAGEKYASVNYTSWTENAEESAIGRALDNAGYSGNKKCSREEMYKASRHEQVLSGGQVPTEHWCKTHQMKFFKTDKMRSYAHPYEDENGKKKWHNEDDYISEEEDREEVNGLQACDCGTWGCEGECREHIDSQTNGLY